MPAADEPAPGGGWRRRTFASLGREPFRRYYLGLLVNMAGFWLRIAATGLFAWQLTGSRECLGIITLAGLLPWVPIAPVAGVWAEWADPRRWLIAVYVLVALVNGGLGWAIQEDLVGWSELLVASVVTGCLRGMEMPARHMVVRRLVDRSRLANAIGLSAAGFHLMHAVGFAAAGLLYEAYGPGACYLGVAATSLAMAVQMMRVRLLEGHAPPERRNVFRELAAGFGYAWTHAITRTLVFGAAGVIFLLLSYRVLMPAIAEDVLGLDESGYGWLMAVSGAGSFAAALWFASGAGGHRVRVRNLFFLVWVACLAVFAVAWSASVALVGGAVFVAGFCQVGFMASANATVQETVPDHLRGRVMGIWALLFGFAYPVGGWLQGWAAERWGERITLSIAVAAALLLSLLVHRTSSRKLAVAVRDELGKAGEQPW